MLKEGVFLASLLPLQKQNRQRSSTVNYIFQKRHENSLIYQLLIFAWGPLFFHSFFGRENGRSR